MYHAANIYVLPSYREGLPLTIFEAMAAGLPIIASPVNGVPYEIKEPTNGLFSNYGDIQSIEDNIVKLIDDKELAEKISNNNKHKANNYKWDNIYLQYIKEYKSLLSKN